VGRFDVEQALGGDYGILGNVAEIAGFGDMRDSPAKDLIQSALQSDDVVSTIAFVKVSRCGHENLQFAAVRTSFYLYMCRTGRNSINVWKER